MATKTDFVSMAKTVLEMADAIERTELEIKEELLNAANEDDLERVKVIVRRWISGPVSNVLLTGKRHNRARNSKSKKRGMVEC